MDKRFQTALLINAVVAVGSPAIAKAEVYQCVGADGTKVFSDQPCDDGLKSPYECGPGPNGVRTFKDKGCSEPAVVSPAPSRIATLPASSQKPAEQVASTANTSASPRPDPLKPMRAAVTNELTQLFTQFWWVVALLIVLGLIRLPFVKGYLGELLVRVVLRIGLPKSEYTVFNNLTLRASDGTTQIDHLVISRFGLFVIETKTMKGWIFGRANEATWTQQIYRSKHRFQNPIRQNHRHMKVLEELLGVPMSHQRSLIAFVGSAEFKTGRPAEVVSASGLLPAIKSIQWDVFSNTETQAIAQRVAALRMKPGRATNRLHVADLERRHRH